MPELHWRVFSAFLSATSIAVLFSGACAQEAFTKPITIIVGLAPGGGYDTYARLLARHLPKSISGAPSVVVQNMPGAGGMRAASYIYNVAPKDGTIIGTFGPTAAIEPLLGNPQAQFDPAKFTWIGNMNKDVLSCGVWRSANIRSWPELKIKGAKFGGTGPLASTTQHARILKNLLGANVRVIDGYAGTNEVNLAMQRGEVDATCGMFLSTVRGPYAQYINDGSLRIVIQFGKENAPEFGPAVNIYDLLGSEDDRRIADFVFLPSSISRPYAAPPGVSDNIADALRLGFVNAVQSVAMIEDAKSLGLDLNFQTGQEVSEAFRSIAKTPRETISKAVAAVSN